MENVSLPDFSEVAWREAASGRLTPLEYMLRETRSRSDKEPTPAQLRRDNLAVHAAQYMRARQGVLNPQVQNLQQVGQIEGEEATFRPGA